MLELEAAVEVARNLTSPQDSLILVTADHSHALTINGYARRGADILGYDSWPESEQVGGGLEIRKNTNDSLLVNFYQCCH